MEMQYVLTVHFPFTKEDPMIVLPHLYLLYKELTII